MVGEGAVKLFSTNSERLLLDDSSDGVWGATGSCKNGCFQTASFESAGQGRFAAELVIAPAGLLFLQARHVCAVFLFTERERQVSVSCIFSDLPTSSALLSPSVHHSLSSTSALWVFKELASWPDTLTLANLTQWSEVGRLYRQLGCPFLHWGAHSNSLLLSVRGTLGAVLAP